eukprot:g271.t1
MNLNHPYAIKYRQYLKRQKASATSGGSDLASPEQKASGATAAAGGSTGVADGNADDDEDGGPVGLDMSMTSMLWTPRSLLKDDDAEAAVKSRVGLLGGGVGDDAKFTDSEDSEPSSSDTGEAAVKMTV